MLPAQDKTLIPPHLQFPVVVPTQVFPAKKRVLKRRKALKVRPAPSPFSRSMTPAELDIARYVWQQKTNKEIAYLRTTELQTVKNQMHEIFLKLNIKTRVGLALWYEVNIVGKINGAAAQ